MSNAAAAKGTRFETKIAKKLTEITGVKYIRVPLSGATQFAKGDLMCDLRSGKLSNFCIECKSYADDQITSNILYPGGQVIDQWMEQTFRQAVNMSTKPMLIFQKDRGKAVVGIDYEVEGIANYLKIVRKSGTMYLYLFDDLIPVIKETLYK